MAKRRKHQRKDEKTRSNKIAELGCVACFVQAGVWGTPGELHHIKSGCGTGQRSGWERIICLCPNHHRVNGSGKFAFHAGKKTFESKYGTEEELLLKTLDYL